MGKMKKQFLKGNDGSFPQKSGTLYKMAPINLSYSTKIIKFPL
jgi:hypothetical protein